MTDVRTVVITGGNSGIGLEAAVGIAQRGHKVVIAVRNESKGALAVADIRARSGNDAVEQMPIDLASLASVRAFAASWNERDEPIHVLLNNAGLVQRSRHTTADGFEMTLGVNHLGHFLLTALLRDAIEAAGGGARIINVASGAHAGARKGLDFDDLMFQRRKYSGMGMSAYAASKLANIMFTRELAKRLQGTGITANALHPGFVGSNFAREGDGGRMGDIGMALLKPFALSTAKGARTSVYLATSPEVATVTGEYFYKCKVTQPSKFARDDAACARLWEISESLVA
jgi:NAD(P)-dependent dehydrogenase (short-subunit alcohol dehydrogenase family)